MDEAAGEHDAGSGGAKHDARATARPLGRRLFLGLLGAGAAGLVVERWRVRGDDVVGSADVASVEAVPPEASGPPPQREALEGQHPNVVTSERFRYYSVGTIPDVDARTFRLVVDGAGSGQPLRLGFDELRAFPNYIERATFRCVTGWRVPDCAWRGVRLADVVDAAKPTRAARFITFHSLDGVYTESLTWEQARSRDALLAWELNGAPLIREQGFPLRLIFPDMYGYKNIKWLGRVELTSQRDIGFWESHDGWEIDAFVYDPGQFRVDPTR